MYSGLMKDPRHYQILVLSSLLIFGWQSRAFEIGAGQIAGILAAACFTQWLGSLLIASRADFRSAIITSLSLTLLLRSDAIWPLAAAAAFAVGSKFMLRLGGKHIFNPANAGIVFMLLVSGAVWTTPGQWGAALWLSALLACAGFFVVYRAARIDVPIIFLGVYAACLLIRAAYLGDPLAIPMLRLQNGALIIFAFFMISDPKTTPDGGIARAIFSAAAALAAYVMTFHFHMNDGLFFSLAILCAVRPLLEWLDPAPKYQWGDRLMLAPLSNRLRAKGKTAPVKAPAE